ncbi:MAG: carbon-nitrogen hydrolase family protein [Thermoplasmata archaeon]
MKVSLVQIESVNDVQKNADKSFDMMQNVKNTDLVIFPEYQMYVPDFNGKDDLRPIAEDDSGKFVTSFVEEAKKGGYSILINIAERNSFNLKPYNSSLMIDSNGMVMKYRKTHLFDAFNFRESMVFERGRSIPDPFLVGNEYVGAMICYDLRFPEIARILRLKGAKILIYQAGWFRGERKYDQWKNLLVARAMENGSYVIGVGQTGPRFTGHTMVVSPYGEIIAEMGEEQSTMEIDLDMSIVDKYLKEVPVIKGRRTDLYDVLEVSSFRRF